MLTIREFLNKLKWDKSENSSEYVFYYLDRKEIKPLEYEKIKRIEGTFLVLGEDETYIPMHRIKRIEKNGKLVLQR
jgi:uncharacterized protein (UPF0248 family)